MLRPDPVLTVSILPFRMAGFEPPQGPATCWEEALGRVERGGRTLAAGRAPSEIAAGALVDRS